MSEELAPALPLDDTAPCIGCGLCCNGTLYKSAPVAEGEEARIRGYGLEITDEGFKLPCRHESCGTCTIYQERFEICRSFRCALLRRYQAGELPLEEARAIVERAFELRSALATSDQQAVMFAERQLLRAELARELERPLDDRSAAAQRLLKIIALDTFLERWFYVETMGNGDVAA